MNGPDRTVASVTSVRSRLSGCGQAGCDSGAVNGVRACICPVADVLQVIAYAHVRCPDVLVDR